MDVRAEKRGQWIDVMTRMGYPSCLGEAVADNLRTEKPMSRMIGYLLSAGPRSEEEIVDEMLAIMSDRDRWVRKKAALLAVAWDNTDTVFKVTKDYYDTICDYMHFQDCGVILGGGCGTPGMTKNSGYPEKAYELGRSM